MVEQHAPSPQGTFRVVEGGLDESDVVALLTLHLARARAETAPGSAHALDINALGAPDIRFWSLRDGAALVAVGALKQITPEHGELKSMHTAEAARGRGAATALLAHIVAEARNWGMTRLSLETGSWDYFTPARKFYAKHGFEPCPPFGNYAADPNSAFFSRSL